MKKLLNKRATVLLLSALLISFISIGVTSINVIAGQNKLSKHEYLQKRTEEKIQAERIAKDYKDSDRPVIDQKELSADIPEFEESSIRDAKDVILPLSWEIARKYSFTNVAYTPHNLIVVGNLIDKPDEGIIINFYVTPKTQEQKISFYSLSRVGKMKITAISDNKKSISFDTDIGKSGVFDVTDGVGNYLIK